MKHALKSISGHRASSASVVDGKLILSFPNALKPVVWQMDLTEAKSSALEVREDKDNQFTLTLKTQKGEAVDVAPFDKREDAMDGLMAVSKALKNAHGQIRPASTDSANANTAHAPKRKGRILPLFLSLGALFVLFLVWANVTTQGPNTGLTQSITPTSGQSSADVNEPGVPISADAFLQNR